MPWTPKTNWATGDQLTGAQLNRIEQGVTDAQNTTPTVVTKTAAYTAHAQEVIEADASGGAFAIAAPTSPSAGDQFWVKKVDASSNAVTITGTLDAAVNPSLIFQWGSAWMIYDGSKWIRPDRHTFGSLANVALGTPADGATVLYQLSTGLWISGAPVVGGKEIAYVENATGTITTASVVGNASGTLVDIPGVAITVPANTGPVWLEGAATLSQTVVGAGSGALYLMETTSGSVLADYDVRPLPNSTAGNANGLGALRVRLRLGAVASTRTFKLQINAKAPASNSPSVAAANGSSGGAKSFLHAWGE